MRQRTDLTNRRTNRQAYGSARHHRIHWTEKTLTHRHTWPYGSARHHMRKRVDLTNRRTDRHKQGLTRLQMKGEGVWLEIKTDFQQRIILQGHIFCEHCDYLSFPSETFNCCHNGKFLSVSFHFPHTYNTFISRILILLKTFVQTFAELILRSNLHPIKPRGTPRPVLPLPPPPPPFFEFMGKRTIVTHRCTLITTNHPQLFIYIYIYIYIYISPHNQIIIVFSILSLVAAGQMC